MSRLPDICGQGRGRGVALVAAFAAGQAATAGAAAFAMRDVFSALSSTAAPLPVGGLALLAAAGIAIAVFRVAERTVGEDVGQAYAASLRETLFRHLTLMSAQQISGRRSGALAIRFVGDLTAVRAWVSLGIARLISAAIVLPGALVALVLLNPILAAAAAVPLVVAVAVMSVLAPHLAPLHRRLRGRRARLAADMSERVPVAPELRLLGRDDKEVRKLRRDARSLRSAAVKRARTAAILRAVPEIGVAVAAALLLFAALSTGAAAAEAAGALATLAILAWPLRDLATIWDRRRAWTVARDKCRSVLDSPTLETACGSTRRRSERAPSVAFVHVRAGPLKDVCATARPGEKIAIFGANGSGKSTILSLAAGLEQAAEGQVLIDGLDIALVSNEDRRELIAYVGARSPILQGSVRRSLTLGIRRRPDDASIEAAARAYGLGDVLDRLGGLEGRLAEGGRNLSSGEAKRIHLARAALARPRLLLLDEPDDAMDATGRACVERLVRETSATTLVVTHDPGFARRLETLWRVERGEVRAVGLPADLHDGDDILGKFVRTRPAA